MRDDGWTRDEALEGAGAGCWGLRGSVVGFGTRLEEVGGWLEGATVQQQERADAQPIKGVNGTRYSERWNYAG